MDMIEMRCKKIHTDDKHRNSNVGAVLHGGDPAFAHCNGRAFVKTKDRVTGSSIGEWLICEVVF
jgi:hypothetical protein